MRAWFFSENAYHLGQAGFLDHDETVKGMPLFAREVYPRLEELGPVEVA